MTSSDRRLLRALLREYLDRPAERGRVAEAIVRRFGQRLAVVVVDTCSFTLRMRLLGAVHTLAMVMALEDRLRPLIGRWGGRLVRAEADNLYAVFPDAAAAVRCAEAMVQATNEANALLPPADDLFISVGIGYGDLLVVGDDLFGDEMNLASKLGEDLAQRDEILLTPAAHAAVDASSWRFDEVSFRASGLELRAYRLVRRPSVLRDGMSKTAADFVVRRAVPADGPFVREFVFATLRSYGIRLDPEGLDADVMAFGTAGDGPAVELVAEVNGRPVGSVALSPRGEGVAWLSKLFVDAAYRGRGLGRALLTRAVAEARRRGYRRIDLETRTIFREAVALYEATGWVRGPDLPPEHGPDRTYSLYLDKRSEG